MDAFDGSWPESPNRLTRVGERLYLDVGCDYKVLLVGGFNAGRFSPTKHDPSFQEQHSNRAALVVAVNDSILAGDAGQTEPLSRFSVRLTAVFVDSAGRPDWQDPVIQVSPHAFNLHYAKPRGGSVASQRSTGVYLEYKDQQGRDIPQILSAKRDAALMRRAAAETETRRDFGKLGRMLARRRGIPLDQGNDAGEVSSEHFIKMMCRAEMMQPLGSRAVARTWLRRRNL